MQTDLFIHTPEAPIPVAPIPHCEAHTNGIKCDLEPGHEGRHMSFYINGMWVRWDSASIEWNYSSVSNSCMSKNSDLLAFREGSFG